MKLPTGTKSLLWGVHAFWLHPWYVAEGWRRLYGFSYNPKLWICFVVHDWGYWGKSNMDDADGETHPELGAKIVHILCDRSGESKWHDFCLLHSRYYSKRLNRKPSRLCIADKLSITLMPSWMYLLLARASGELDEYLKDHKDQDSKYSKDGLSCDTHDPVNWYKELGVKISAWAYNNKYNTE